MKAQFKSDTPRTADDEIYPLVSKRRRFECRQSDRLQYADISSSVTNGHIHGRFFLFGFPEHGHDQ